MSHLHERLGTAVDAWRLAGYPCPQYPIIKELFDWATDPSSKERRFLRAPQLRALETYWYLRLQEQTPHIFELYLRLFTKSSELRYALGLTAGAIRDFVEDEGIEALWDRIRVDDQFVREFRLESLRESLTLQYPSYILALAMGAGKTILIGAIVATEFAMAMEYPNGPFVQNALVFAPGKTIVESLRELVEVPYDRILPPRLYSPFAATVKLTFTRDGEKDLPVIRGSLFNVVVTNTEKIRIQKEAVRKSDLGNIFAPGREDEARAEIANLRLQAIASLPQLAIFSDEAHHTYGQSLDSELKKVRRTVDYLAERTNVCVVVNTTGTPYFERQPLRDVVIWYGLAEGIRDGILKDVTNNIRSYEFDGDARAYVHEVVSDFLREYGDVCLPNGAPAKLAMYFPQTADLRELKPIVERAMASAGLSPDLALVNTSDTSLTSQADIDSFNRLNDPTALHRVILLVNKGTEGWNCPSLFACALARKLKTSNNFVLQAATRCLRQIPGNLKSARIYLSNDNRAILDKQLQETYGESLLDLDHAARETHRTRVTVRKLDIPPLLFTRTLQRIVQGHSLDSRPLVLTRPKASATSSLRKAELTIGEQQSTYSVLQQLGETIDIAASTQAVDAYAAAEFLGSTYRLNFWIVYDEVRRLYMDQEDVPHVDVESLATQIEMWQGAYRVVEETVDVALALLRPDGFKLERDAMGAVIYTAEIVYPKDREHLLLSWATMESRNPNDFGFHYSPYDFDSNSELDFFERLVRELNVKPEEVEDLLFTGALTDPAKTDFFVEYKDERGQWRRYTPDFVLRKKPMTGAAPGTGRVLIVEIKSSQFKATIEHELKSGEAHSVEGRKALAVKRWEQLNPEHLRYEIIFDTEGGISTDQVARAATFIEGAK
jgi:type III restriction enzyme